ncbi:dihydroorotate dehydrogenase-like protein [bacterium]|nr:dihydroorotate dehydrogenase-like protein [candidate division CSSED10-310 bacterium]
MADIHADYMGIRLKNPLIVASCSLVKSVENVQDCERNGAGAVVLKSLFEEQIRRSAENVTGQADGLWHTESYDYLYNTELDFGENEYLDIIRESKKSVSIPVIASINCYSDKGWTEYARRLQKAGADAIELNISCMPSDPGIPAEQIEKHHFNILENVRKLVTIPIAVKIGPYFSSLSRFAAELSWRGAGALVLFNRFYQFDIDTDKMRLKAGNRFSSPDETHVPLRWIALLSGRIRCDLAASTGIHDARGVIKHILAGASAVQLCSTLYLNGLDRIGAILKEMAEWMDEHGFASLGDFRGILGQRKSEDPEGYERLQYIKALVGIE